MLITSLQLGYIGWIIHTWVERNKSKKNKTKMITWNVERARLNFESIRLLWLHEGKAGASGARDAGGMQIFDTIMNLSSTVLEGSSIYRKKISKLHILDCFLSYSILIYSYCNGEFWAILVRANLWRMFHYVFFLTLVLWILLVQVGHSSGLLSEEI